MARSFPGAGWLTGSDTGMPTGSAARTITFWMKTTTRPAAFGEVFGYGTRTFNQLVAVGPGSTTQMSFSQFGGGVSLTCNYYDGLWHFYTLTCTSGGLWSLAQDMGTPATGSPGTGTTLGGANGVAIGADHAAAEFFTGTTADIAVWSALLTADELTTLYKGASPTQVRPASLVRYWPLFGNPTTGLLTEEPDLAGSVTQLTVTGSGSAIANEGSGLPLGFNFNGNIGLNPGVYVPGVVYPPPWQPPDRNRVQRNAEWAEMEEAHHAMLLQRQMRHQVAIAPRSATTNFSVSKFVQYVVTGPPDAGVSIAKMVQYVVTESSPPVPTPSPYLQRPHRVLGPVEAEEAEEHHRRLLWRAQRIRGTPMDAYYTPIHPTGIASGVALGVPIVLNDSVNLTMAGIGSTVALGTPILVPGATTLLPGGIGSGVLLGTFTFNTDALISLAGISTKALPGTPTLLPSGVTIVASGIASSAVPGTPMLAQGPVIITGIPTHEALGTPTLSLLSTIPITGIASLLAIGAPSLLAFPPRPDLLHGVF